MNSSEQIKQLEIALQHMLDAFGACRRYQPALAIKEATEALNLVRKPKYEQDDGPLSDEQVEAIKCLASGNMNKKETDARERRIRRVAE